MNRDRQDGQDAEGTGGEAGVGEVRGAAGSIPCILSILVRFFGGLRPGEVWG